MNSVNRKDPAFSRVYLTAFMLALAVAFAVLAVVQFANANYRKQVHMWQVKLGVIADSRLAAVDEWIERQLATVEDLARNEAVRGYLAGKDATLPAQKTYIRQLLDLAAEREGFVKGHEGGVALLDASGAIVVATEHVPTLDAESMEAVRRAEKSKTLILDFLGSENPFIGFLAPVFSPDESRAQTGWIIGIHASEEALFMRMKHPGVIENTFETLLVREENDGVRYLSPLADGTPASEAMREKENSLAAAFALQEPGRFALRRDYAQHNVLVTGRKVPGTPWTLVAKVDEDDALSLAKAERRATIRKLLLVVALVFAAIIAAWRFGASRNSEHLAERLEFALKRAKTRGDILSVITHYQPGSVFITDSRHRCCYANDAMAAQAGMEREVMAGKFVDHLVGAALGEQYSRASDNALLEGKPVTWMRREQDTEGNARVLRCKHIPLRQLPADGAGPGEKGVLVVEQDVTGVVLERERRERSLRGLVDALVAMVDKRDPYAANHSILVSTLSREVAEQMKLEPLEVETAEIAGKLMNIGKMSIPGEWLTKAGVLDEKERKAIRESLLSSADMLKDVAFDGPVAETLRQAIENWDGTGRGRLKGENILITARIIAAANALAVMVSPRAYRKALKMDDALALLQKSADKEFDGHVVAALVNYIDNHGGRAMMASLAHTSKAG